MRLCVTRERAPVRWVILPSSTIMRATWRLPLLWLTIKLVREIILYPVSLSCVLILYRCIYYHKCIVIKYYAVCTSSTVSFVCIMCKFRFSRSLGSLARYVFLIWIMTDAVIPPVLIYIILLIYISHFYDWGWVGRLSAHPSPIIKMAPGFISSPVLIIGFV